MSRIETLNLPYELRNEAEELYKLGVEESEIESLLHLKRRK